MSLLVKVHSFVPFGRECGYPVRGTFSGTSLTVKSTRCSGPFCFHVTVELIVTDIPHSAWEIQCSLDF